MNSSFSTAVIKNSSIIELTSDEIINVSGGYPIHQIILASAGIGAAQYFFPHGALIAGGMFIASIACCYFIKEDSFETSFKCGVYTLIMAITNAKLLRFQQQHAY